MRKGRRLARRLALQTLFEMEARSGLGLEETLAQRVAGLEEEAGEAIDPGAVDFARNLVRGAIAERTSIDGRIGHAAPAFPVEQLPRTDRVALELALFELLHARREPVKVVINEAVELAKIFGGESSGRFVNGVLGTIARELVPDVRAEQDGSEASQEPRTQSDHRIQTRR